MLFLLLFVTFVQSQTGSCGTSCTYTKNNNVLTISGSGKIETHPWSINPNYDNQITKVIINQWITEIGSYIFSAHYELESVTLPNTIITIGTHGFSKTNLKEIVIPDSVELIEDYAFF